MFRTKLAVPMAAILVMIAFVSRAAADIDDYEFQLVSKTIIRADAVVIDVRIIDRRTQLPINDAIIFATRLDMEPDGMETMTTPLTPLDPAMETDLGIYRFTASLAMAGGWRLSLAAKIQGEDETLQSRLVFQAIDQ